jgi:hypothetical protein
MRYPQGGGLTAERRAFRERIRLEAAELFAVGQASAVIAKELRASVRSVQRWRPAWQDDGPDALRSKGPASLPKLSAELFAVLEQELDKGAVGARLAGPDLDPVLDQDADRTKVPQKPHALRYRPDAATQRVESPSSRPTRARTQRRSRAGWVKETWPSVEAPRRRPGPSSSSRTKPASR